MGKNVPEQIIRGLKIEIKKKVSEEMKEKNRLSVMIRHERPY